MKWVIKYIWVLCLFIACNKTEKPKLTLSEEKIVNLLVDLYIIKSTIATNHPDYQDSTRLIYFEQLSNIHGISISEIKLNLEELTKDPDSLMILQNRALDTFRIYQEQQFEPQNTGQLINN